MALIHGSQHRGVGGVVHGAKCAWRLYAFRPYPQHELCTASAAAPGAFRGAAVPQLLAQADCAALSIQFQRLSQCCGVTLRLTLTGWDPIPPELEPQVQSMRPRVNHVPIQLEAVWDRLELVSQKSYDALRNETKTAFVFSTIKPLVLLLFKELLHPNATHIGYLDTDAVYGASLSRAISALERRGLDAGPLGQAKDGKYHAFGPIQYYRAAAWERVLVPAIYRFLRDPHMPRVFHGWDEWGESLGRLAGKAKKQAFNNSLSGILDRLVRARRWRACSTPYCRPPTPQESIGCANDFTRNGASTGPPTCTACELLRDSQGRMRLISHTVDRHSTAEGVLCHFIDLNKVHEGSFACKSAICFAAALRVANERCVKVEADAEKGPVAVKHNVNATRAFSWSTGFNHFGQPWKARWSLCAASDERLLELDQNSRCADSRE